ncbi:AAA family ATPase [Oceanicoccus sp. KOV_DT_Chl]|uniref:tyrosine-protein kinase family protein n=1 Tax=Oceanicoccus sp. KOV_DT_Chl TaxID=1904639 RepID=UPI000C79B9BC|nr:AAA family ATPase [Oceanicoccus sp. KOV_DT_Chl]
MNNTVDQEGSVSDISNMAEVAFKSHEELAALKIIYPGMPQREVLNSFRDLRTRLLHRTQGKNFVLLVSSLSLGGGSSFVAMNMAASFALDEQKTAIYIDCNFDHSFANKLLKDNRDYGLMEYLQNADLELKDIIYSTGIPRVRVIPPGVGGDVAEERLASPRMSQLIDSVKERYPDRFVVLDVPPAMESSLARILSRVSDMAVLVVPFGKVTPNQVMAGVDAVGEQKFAGLVFNN